MGTTTDTEWAAGSRDGTVAVLRRDGDRATLVDVGDGVVRVRVLHRTVRGWVSVSDATLEAVCELEPVDPDPVAALLCEAA